MNLKTVISHERLLQVISYDRDTGLFIWRQTLSSRACAGKEAGTPDLHGYKQICIDGKIYKSHRLAVFYETKTWPKMDIDHIDGNKSNNKISNLREVTKSQNQFNRPVSKNSKSGIKGVHMDGRGRWRAYIAANGKKISIGSFGKKEDAALAYRAFEQKLHGEFARKAQS